MAIQLQGNGTSTFSNNITSSTGDLTLGDGNLVVADGHGIDFSATEGSNASTSLLDDYEEGTWTPSYFNNGNGAITKVFSAEYIKIGDLVRVSAFIELSNKGTNTTEALDIYGLPYTSAGSEDYYAVSVGYFQNWNTNISFLAGTVQPTETKILVRGVVGTEAQSTTNFTATHIKNSAQLIFTATYKTS